MMKGFHPETSLCQLSKREIFNFENLWKLIRSKLSANVEHPTFVHTLGGCTFVQGLEECIKSSGAPRQLFGYPAMCDKLYCLS